jgi:hypothetical protein
MSPQARANVAAAQRRRFERETAARLAEVEPIIRYNVGLSDAQLGELLGCGTRQAQRFRLRLGIKHRSGRQLTDEERAALEDLRAQRAAAREASRRPCECGCGDLAKPDRRFIKGHSGGPKRDVAAATGPTSPRSEPRAPVAAPAPLPLCGCGCGAHVTKHTNRYVVGHTGRPRKVKPARPTLERPVDERNQGTPRQVALAASQRRKERQARKRAVLWEGDLDELFANGRPEGYSKVWYAAWQIFNGDVTLTGADRETTVRRLVGRAQAEDRSRQSFKDAKRAAAHPEPAQPDAEPDDAELIAAEG